VFTAHYQTAGMLNFYQPQLEANQWPGITRPSEYLRGQIARPATPEEIRNAGGFWLITRHAFPPDLPGYRGKKTRELIDCPGLPLQAAGKESPCARPLHVWRFIRYEPLDHE
jgi:hypothetical protein